MHARLRSKERVRNRLSACSGSAYELLGSIGRELSSDQILRRCDRYVDRVVPQLAHRFHLGAGNLLLGELYAAIDMFLQRLACLRSKGLCLLGGERDDVVHLSDDIAQLAPVVSEQLFRLLPEPARLLELFADPKRAGIERARDFLMDAEIDEHTDEDEERYRDPEFGLVDELHGHHANNSGGPSAVFTVSVTSGSASTGMLPTSKELTSTGAASIHSPFC